MVLRFTSPAARAAVLIVALLVSSVLCFCGIRNAVAEHSIAQNTLAGYERAVRLEPANATNWYLLGRYWQYNLQSPDLERAIAYYRHALVQQPRFADAWLELAKTYEAQGQVSEARDAFISAQKTYPASAKIAWSYGNFLLREDTLDHAFAEIHFAVLNDPGLAAEAFSRCWRAKPDAQIILDEVIPPSKDDYVAILRELSASRLIDPALAVWKRLVALHVRMSPLEVAPFTNTLLRENRLSDLASVWQQAVTMMPNPPSPDPPGSVLWDGGFESGLTGAALAWQVPKSRGGVLATIDPSEKHGGNHSVRLIFSGRESYNYADTCHTVIVEPGVSYRLSGWVLTKGLDTDEGIRLRLSFPGKNGVTYVETPDVHGTAPWTRLALLWTAPQEAHVANICIARHSGGSFENAEGSAWVDDVSLVPLFQESPKQ